MRRLGHLIVEEGLTKDSFQRTRQTVRGIIINDDHHICLLYSKVYDDFTFPGGGIKAEEDHECALRRELKEEIGAEDITIETLLCTTEEIRYGIRGDEHVYLQTSYYYVCQVHMFGEPTQNKLEKKQKLEHLWVSYDEAISKNLSVMQDINHTKKGLRTVLQRENLVLNYLKELNHEKI